MFLRRVLFGGRVGLQYMQNSKVARENEFSTNSSLRILGKKNKVLKNLFTRAE